MKRLTAVVALGVAIAVPCHAQTLAGKWLGETPDGGSIGLDLTVADLVLNGAIVFTRGGQSISMEIRRADLIGNTFTIRLASGNDMPGFSGEYSGDRVTLRPLFSDPSVSAIVLNRVDAFPQAMLDTRATSAPASAPSGWRAYNRAATLVDEAGRQVLRVDERPGDGVIWQEGSDLTEGTIVLQIRGRNAPGQSFVGIAFRGADDTTYDAIYFRPFHFRAEEPGRQRAVQYVSHPDHPWARLRAESPGRYENAISPVPDPDGWFRARIVIEGRTLNVFVDDATTPTLTVDALTEARGGLVGYWVGNGSGGDFANLELTRRNP